MKKLLGILLLLLLAVSLGACSEETPKELSCEEIIKAYEDAGYYVIHGEHQEESESPYLCYVKASLSQAPDSDYIYFYNCFTEEQSKKAAETDQYNLAVWLYASVCGETRWLKTGTYGNVAYSYYNAQLIAPFHELIQ